MGENRLARAKPVEDFSSQSLECPAIACERQSRVGLFVW